ncbi:auxilin-like protein, partial [Trifolium medium]|nr:auxilin-like protein [Trifolium medium]
MPAYMSQVEYRVILKYRLMIPLFLIDEVCPVCRKACLDNFGDHAVHCRELPNFKYSMTLSEISFLIVLGAREAPVNFLTDPQKGQSTLRPTDVMVYGWVGGKHACVDLTGVLPLVGLKTETFTVGQAALKASS